LTQPLRGRTAWARVRAVLQARDRALLVALDLDGTVAPIAPHPDLARVPRSALRAIERAAGCRDVKIAIVSARPRSDLKRLVPVRGLILVGQYGLDGPLAPPRRLLTRFVRGCARVTRALRTRVRSIPGAFLEPKGLTVAVHSRQVKGRSARRLLLEGLLAVASHEAEEEGFVPIPGVEAMDFVPRGYDKGKALKALLARIGPDAVVYFGDSEGDEPAFAVLGAKNVSVRVGRGATRARYRVAGIQGVTRFLDAVAAHRAGAARSKEVDP
jgi:trehalose 6-phosphate phosphatase